MPFSPYPTIFRWDRSGYVYAKKTCFEGAEDSLRIIITGDLLLDRGVRQKIEMVGVDALFSPSIDSLFHASDYVIANLECPVTKIRERVFKRFIFRGEPEWLPTLRCHGITHLNLANNHSIDQGRRGLLDTQEQIKKAGMIPIGLVRIWRKQQNQYSFYKSTPCLGSFIPTFTLRELPLPSSKTLC